MNTRIHMGEDLGDIIVDVVEIDGLPFITIEADGMPKVRIIATPEGARSMAYTIIGVTDEMRRKS